MYGHKHTEETKRLLSEKARTPSGIEIRRRNGRQKRGSKHSQKTKDILRFKSGLRKHTPEEREKMHNAMKGRKLTPQCYAAALEAKRTRGISLEGRINMSLAQQNRPTRAIVDHLGNQYKSAAQAARSLNLSPGLISLNLNGKRTSVRGYKFRYVSEESGT